MRPCHAQSIRGKGYGTHSWLGLRDELTSRETFAHLQHQRANEQHGGVQSPARWSQWRKLCCCSSRRPDEFEKLRHRESGTQIFGGGEANPFWVNVHDLSRPMAFVQAIQEMQAVTECRMNMSPRIEGFQDRSSDGSMAHRWVAGFFSGASHVGSG